MKATVFSVPELRRLATLGLAGFTFTATGLTAAAQQDSGNRAEQGADAKLDRKAALREAALDEKHAKKMEVQANKDFNQSVEVLIRTNKTKEALDMIVSASSANPDKLAYLQRHLDPKFKVKFMKDAGEDLGKVSDLIFTDGERTAAQSLQTRINEALKLSGSDVKSATFDGIKKEATPTSRMAVSILCTYGPYQPFKVEGEGASKVQINVKGGLLGALDEIAQKVAKDSPNFARVNDAYKKASVYLGLAHNL